MRGDLAGLERMFSRIIDRYEYEKTGTQGFALASRQIAHIPDPYLDPSALQIPENPEFELY